MRIGLIAPPWLPVPPPAYGGTESVVDRLARGLVEAGHDVLLAAAANSSCPVRRVPGTDAAADGAPVIGDSVTEVRHVVTSYAAMSGMDVIHDHTLAGPLFGGGLLRTPVVTTNHGPFDATLTPIYRGMHVPVIAISHAQASTAEDVPVVGVIHHGIDVAAVPLGTGQGGYASFLGRMCPEKGPREAALIAREAGVPLLMAAKIREPAERDYFEAEVKPLLCCDVEYVGELAEKDKLELLGGSFALLNPIQWAEPFGLVMIEALAAGTPVVGTSVGAAPEIIDEGITGYLGRKPPELVALLLDAANLDRAPCRAAASRRFDTTRMVAEHVAVYQDLLTSPVPSQRDGAGPGINGTSKQKAAWHNPIPRTGTKPLDLDTRIWN
ncbi:MAG: glycosyl transferase, group 1 [Marmoricola sp.]|nr:glycosyl transferase, group 1 [Marmoricola sp.]